ncbi:MAG: hypothetical protein JSR27_00170 [Proteobacteria bacterium]|nr:hypothetical protein [Pseudomonadota bacterium]
MSHTFQRLFLVAALFGCIGVHATDGDLDPSFGSGGKVRLTVDPFNQPTGATLVATDVVVQPDGKILLAGYAAASDSEWIVIRLNEDGSYDNTFGIGQNGIAYFYVFGPADNQATSIALRPNGKIVVGGTINDSNTGLVTAVAIQLNSNGSLDSTWGNNGAVYFTPVAGDATRTRAIVLDTVDPYALGTLYLVGQYTHGGNFPCNHFFYGGISVDGKTRVSNDYGASDACTVNESATSVAVQPGTGNIIVGGFSAFASGASRCTAISTVILPSPVFSAAHLYTPWGTNGVTSFTVAGAPIPNDYCDATTVTAGGSTFLAGRGTMAIGSNTYQAAILGWLDANGAVVKFGLGPEPALIAFDYHAHTPLIANDANTVNKLIVQPYGSLLLPAGYNNDPHYVLPFTGDDFAVGRFSVSSGNGLNPDPAFNNGTGAIFDWGSYFNGPNNIYVSNERVQSEAFDPQGRLILVGYSADPAGGTDIAIARLKPFDGIFKSSFEAPSY